MLRSRRLLGCAVLAFLGCLPLASTEIPIDGRVRDSGGVALAGVRVELRPILSSYEQGLRELDGRAVEAAARTVTAADGRFELLAPGEGMWEVGVSGEGWMPQRFRLTPLTGAETLFPVTLRRDAGLRMRVEGPDGRPLAGARVVGRPLRDEEPGWQPVPRIATSGADGMARLSCSRDEMLALLATAPGFPVQEGPEARGPAEVTFRLAAGASHRVEAPDGALLRDLQTSLVLGRGSIEVVTRGEPWLLLETADGVQVRFAVPAKEGPVRVEVPASAPLPGRVIDTWTRQPLAGAWVWPRDDPGRFARTDGRGEARLEIAGRSRAVGLQAAAAGHLPEIVDDDLDWQPGSIPPVALDPELILTGTVVDGQGRPAAGAEVIVFGQPEAWFQLSSSDRRPPRVGRVSAGGEVRISGLRAGVGHDVLVTGPGFSPVWLKMGVPKGRENRFALTLSRGGSAAGRIVDAQGRPVADAEVAVVPALESLEGPLRDLRLHAVTGPDGRFAFAEMPAGWYWMTGRRAGSVAQVLPWFEVRSDVGQIADVGDVRLDDGEVLAARVVDPEGRPVAGAEVWAGGQEGDDWPAAVSGTEGPDGSFSLRASPWQPLDLTVCGPGFVPLGRSLPGFVPGEPLVLTVQPGASVSGRILRSDGLPAPRDLPNAGLIGVGGGFTAHSCEGGGWGAADEAGRFRIGSLEPGLYSIGSLDPIPLAAGETREVAIRYREQQVGASISGRLLGRDGLPVPGAEIGLRARVDHGDYYTEDGEGCRTDAEGSYRLTFSRPGLPIDKSSYGIARHGRTYVLRGFSSDGSSEWPGPETVPEQGRLDLVLDELPEPLEPVARAELHDQRRAPEPLSTLTGRILGLTPGELAQARVTAEPASGRGRGTAGTVDAQGVYRLEGLERQEWRVRADAADRSHFETVHIPEDEARITRDLPFEPVIEVRGRVETPGGEPVAGAAVHLRSLAQPFEVRRPDAGTLTRSDGWFAIRLPLGYFEATASRDGFVPSPEAAEDFLEVRASLFPRTVNLWLQPAVVLRGRIAGLPPGEDRVDVEATRVDGTPGYRRPIEGKLEAEGRYVIPGLGPGTWDVEVSYETFPRGEHKATGQVVIPEEAAGEMRLDLAFSGK